MQEFEKKLIDAGFPGLFMYGERSLADAIWDGGKNETALKELLASGTASHHAKFLAAEVLRKYEVSYDENIAGALAETYAEALRNTSESSGNAYHLSGNHWGFLYELNDAGHLGSQFIIFGDAAVPALTPLLDDDGTIMYEGSQEATLGNSYQYRVKDFAAFYISKIKNIPIQFHKDIQERDKEIERLKMNVKP